MIGADCEFPPGVVAVITGDLLRYAQAAQSIEDLVAPAGSHQQRERGANVAGSINQAINVMMSDERFQWIWLMGDDHVFPPDILFRLLARNVDCVVPMCLNRFPPFDPTIIDQDTHQIKFIGDMPDGGLYQLAENENCGDAGMLIRRQVIEKLGAPWYDRTRSGSLGVDDQVFVQRIKRAGFAVHMDCDNVIGHMSPFTMLPYRRDGKWHVRLLCGSKHAADLIPQRRQG